MSPLHALARLGAVLASLALAGCVSLGEHERKMAELRAAQLAETKQNESLVATIATLHAALRTERELREAVLKQFDRQLSRLNETTTAIDSRLRDPNAARSQRDPSAPPDTAQQAELRAELQRLKGQEKALTQRIERLESALQSLGTKSSSPPGAKVSVDASSPWQR